MNSIKGKNVLITGATSGLGKALALQCARLGANLALCGRSPEKLLNLREDLEDIMEEGIVYSKVFSVRDPEAIKTFVHNAEEQLGDLHILINCAGLNSRKDLIEDISLEDWDEMMEVNVRAPMLFSQQVMRKMKKAKQGLIVNILSSVCFYHGETMGAYTASKGAFQSLTGVMRREAAKCGVNVMAVYPGGINTSFRPKENKDYMSPEGVATCIINAMQTSPDVMVHELVMRPQVENNFP